MTRLRAEDAKRRIESGRSRDFLEVLARSINVITALGGGDRALTLSDVARATGLPKPSVRRVLHTLCALGYAEMGARTFKLTPKIMRLATAYLGTTGNSRLLQSACESLQDQTGQSCLAGVLDGPDVVVMAYTVPRQLMAPSLGVGARFPAFCTAAGRLLLAELDDEELSAFLKNLRPVAQTDATITDKNKIRAKILEAKKLGYSWMEDEFTPGWKTIAHTLRRHDGSIFGALSLNIQKTSTLTPSHYERFFERCAAQATALKSLLT